MKNTLLAVGFGLSLSVLVSAAPIDCNSMSNLQQYLDQSALGGCMVQDKLFTNFTYAGGGTESASQVSVSATLASVPGIDIHGFTFVPKAVWTSDFTIGYTIGVIPPSGSVIVAALDQINVGPLSNAASVVSTKGNGQVYTLDQTAGVTQSSLFAPVTSLSSSTTATIPAGAFLISLEEQYTQRLGPEVPEPATVTMLAGGLLGLLLIGRRLAA
ncbi:MAG TPA: hypothetical protein VF767_10865 [Bryobacteraceae bacterium]